MKPERIYNDNEVDVKPQFGKLPESIFKFLGSNISYPVEAARNNISGMVIVYFVITKEGKMDSLKVTTCPEYGLREEALWAVRKSAGNWRPAKLKNELVACRVYLPVTFRTVSNDQMSASACVPPQPKVDKVTQKLIEQAEQANEYYNKGLDNYEQNKLEAAKVNFDKTLAIKPDHVPALQNRGIIKYKLKDLAGACADWQRIVQLGQPLPEALVNACK